MRFTRVDSDRLATPSGRYQVEKMIDVTECEHPDCWWLHRKYHGGKVHEVQHPYWIVWDNETGDYAEGRSEGFDTQQAAREFAERLEVRGDR